MEGRPDPILRYPSGCHWRSKKRIQTPVDNRVNDLHYEIKFENCVKDRNNFFIKQNISFHFKTKIYFILGNIFF